MSEIDIVTETPVKKNKGGRPKKVAAPAAATFSDEQFQQLIGALTAQRSDSAGGVNVEVIKELLEGAARVSALETQRAANPSNKEHPGISSFSYPEGDIARPRPALKCEIYWNNYPVHKNVETHHWRELELLNQLEPGEYTVLRKDGAPMPEPVTVEGKRDATGKLTRLDVKFSVNREERHYISPMVVMLYQMVHADVPPKQSYMQAWTREWMGTVLEMAAV